ncbi:MAG: phytanoyl-CoA dioxygenase family protein [Candidatus Handelsmanbacteria bacterium]|nr:phytanoyl-CoA dioxygenase family protein [Candidatus Handelsmanbacteria bacterium]
MSVSGIEALTYYGNPIDTSPAGFGELRRSDAAMDDVAELCRRIEEDGYLFLPGLLDREEVAAARQEVMDRLQAAGILDGRYPAYEGVVKPDHTISFMPQLAKGNQPLMKLLYEGAMMDFYRRFLGGPVRHYDYTWFRAKTPGTRTATQPHYDVVYMGRGTRRLYTSWTPLVDVPWEMGGLMVLENSHRQDQVVNTYGQTDVDAYCEEGNAREMVEAARSAGRELTPEERQQIRWNSTGCFSPDAIAARSELGGRWLSAEYQMGDLLVFGMYTLHASTDNHTDRIRISSDSRYQLASEPVDDRWIGEDPPIHGIRAKRGMVC